MVAICLYFCYESGLTKAEQRGTPSLSDTMMPLRVLKLLRYCLSVCTLLSLSMQVDRLQQTYYTQDQIVTIIHFGTSISIIEPLILVLSSNILSGMRKADIHPIRHVEPSPDYSLLNAGDNTASEKSLLMQRVEFLELENSEYRKREEYLKMINSTLMEALGNKDNLKDLLVRISQQNEGQFQMVDNDHMNKMNSFKRKAKMRKAEAEEAQRRSIETVYENDPEPKMSCKQTGFLNSEDYFSKGKPFSKAKNQTMFAQRKQYFDLTNFRSSTPKVQNRLSQNYNSHTRKSVNSLLDPFNMHNSFSKKEIYLSGSAKSQKSQKSFMSNNLAKNIATALLCDLCGMSYPPLQFMTHARDCQSLHQFQQEHELNKITDKSFQQDESSESDSEDLLETLEQEKNALLSQINKLKKGRNPDKRLERNLDQIVFIINNKKQLNQNDIRTLLKQRNSHDTKTNSTARKR